MANKWQSYDANPCSLTPESVLVTNYTPYLCGWVDGWTDAEAMFQQGSE